MSMISKFWWAVCAHGRQCWRSSIGEVSLGKNEHVRTCALQSSMMWLLLCYWLRCFCLIQWQTCWLFSAILYIYRFGHATSSMVFCNMDACVPLELSLHVAMSWGLCKLCTTWFYVPFKTWKARTFDGFVLHSAVSAQLNGKFHTCCMKWLEGEIRIC